MTSELSKECLWYRFSGVIQEDLDGLREHWNTHRIRQSRYDTVAGRPYSLYYLPEHHGAVSGLLMEVPQREINYVSEHTLVNNYTNDYQEYFDYAWRSVGAVSSNNWQQVYELYSKLMDLKVAIRTFHVRWP